MKKMVLSGLMAAAAVLAFAPAAQATKFTPGDGTGNFTVQYGDPTLGTEAVEATFQDAITGSKAGKSFTDDFVFEIGGNGTGSGSVTTSFSSALNSLKFTDVLINGVSITDKSMDGTLTSLGGNVSGFKIAANTPIDLRIEGIAYGHAVYTGTATFTPSVPELATWGMMILGFGVVGAAMRRQRSSAAGYQKGSTNVSFA